MNLQDFDKGNPNNIPYADCDICHTQVSLGEQLTAWVTRAPEGPYDPQGNTAHLMYVETESGELGATYTIKICHGTGIWTVEHDYSFGKPPHSEGLVLPECAALALMDLLTNRIG